jgi:hypothetical protein
MMFSRKPGWCIEAGLGAKPVAADPLNTRPPTERRNTANAHGLTDLKKFCERY